MGLVLSNSLTEPPFANLTDVTLADEDTNSILTDEANRAMQVAFYFAGEITQVLDAIPWVRCASGNI